MNTKSRTRSPISPRVRALRGNQIENPENAVRIKSQNVTEIRANILVSKTRHMAYLFAMIRCNSLLNMDIRQECPGDLTNTFLDSNNRRKTQMIGGKKHESIYFA